MCIDLKTFYASVECVKRGLDPFKTNLVVADPSRGNGALCLAISPRLKELGVKNRCRLFEIPEGIDYIVALPKMKDYMRYSADIYKIYLKYFAKEDIYPYSIDECFIDLTSYLKLYKLDYYELAKMVINAVFKETKISAKAGIGTNLFLAKVALDILAKKNIDGIAFLDIDKFKEEIWFHTPITDIWNIGPGIARRLLKYNVRNLYQLSKLDQNILYDEFGKNALYLIDHSKGIEPCKISDIKAYRPVSKSISNSQILFEDYNANDAYTILKEMVENNILNLINKKLVCGNISLYVGYSKDLRKPTGGSYKIGEYTNSYKKLLDYFKALYKTTIDENYLIRRIGIAFNDLKDEKYKTINLFTDEFLDKKENDLAKTIIEIKNRYGKNSILKGMNLEAKANQIKRNKLVGGHNG